MNGVFKLALTLLAGVLWMVAPVLVAQAAEDEEAEVGEPTETQEGDTGSVVEEPVEPDQGTSSDRGSASEEQGEAAEDEGGEAEEQGSVPEEDIPAEE